MPESILTEPIKIERDVSRTAPGSPAKKSSKAFNSFQIAQAQFDKVAEYLGLDSATRDLLRYPLREYQFAIPVRMDDGVADFNYPAGVEIFIGNGDGTFQSGVKYLTRSTYHLAVADFNGDGHLDLLSLQDIGLYGRRKLWTLQLGNGDGTFQSPVDHYNLMIDTQAIAAADFNRDGFADLALTDSTDVAVFPNLGNCP